MKPGSHLAASLAVSAALYALFRSLSISFWSLAGGTLIDIDHLYDYAVHPRRPACRDFSLRHFFDVMYNRRLDRVFVLLHAFELAAALLVGGSGDGGMGDTAGVRDERPHPVGRLV